jgi:chemotaxis protein MotB
VILEGHTDAAPFGSAGGAYGNWELSADRANAARRVLEDVGLNERRIVEVRGYAATKPRILNDPLSAANRRISILLPYTNVPDAASVNAESLAVSKQDSMVGAIAESMRRNE